MRSARVVVGGLLVGGGVAWLLHSAGLIEVSVGVVLSVGLIAVGVALVAGAGRRGGYGALIALGLVLTFVLSAGSVVRGDADDIDLIGGGVGDRSERPTTRAEAQQGYRLSAGRLDIDLTAVQPVRGRTDVNARLGTGNLTVTVPEGVAVRIRSEVRLGQITIFGEEVASGPRARRTFTSPGYRTADYRFDLDLRVGAGQIVVESALSPLSPPEADLDDVATPEATPEEEDEDD